MLQRKRKLIQKIEFGLKSVQFDFVTSQAKFPGFIGAWATGKSLSAILRALIFSQETPKNLGLICRKEYTDLRDSTIKDFEQYTGLKVNEQTKEVKLQNGSTIMFRHAEELDTLKNINLGFFFLEQAEELLTSDQFFYLCGRLRREAKRRSGWITANANGHNWIWQTWLSRKDPEFEAYESTTYENADVLPKDFIDSLSKLPERIHRQYVLNDHSIAEGLVWPEFDEKIHTSDSFEIPELWKETIGLDHGHDHPTAVIFGACDYDGKLIIYNEHYEAGQLISYHAKKIKEMEPSWDKMDRIIDHTCRYKTMQDGSRVYSVMEAYGEQGVNFRPSIADPNLGIQIVADLFKQNKILIFKDKCPNLIQEIKNWKWKRPRPGQENLKEEAIRLKDDACKALIYLASGRPEAAKKVFVESPHMTEGKYLDIVDQYSRFHGVEQLEEAE